MTPAYRNPDLNRAFRTSFPARHDALTGARHAFAEWVHLWAGADVADEMEVVFSELTANAVDASRDVADQVVSRAWCDGADLVIDIQNKTDSLDCPASGWDLDDPLRTGGRGLVIAKAFVDSLEVDLEPGERLAVRCRRRIE